MIFVSSNRTYAQSDNQNLTVLINGTAAPITAQLIVTSAPVSSVLILTDLTQVQTTDSDYYVQFLPQDMFGNNITSTPQSLNVQVIFPQNASISFQATLDSTTDIVTF
jgi:hypothetical protein